MAIIQCPECKREISDQSTVCVHCGYPIQSDTVSNVQQSHLKSEPLQAKNITTSVRGPIFSKRIIIISACIAVFVILMVVLLLLLKPFSPQAIRGTKWGMGIGQVELIEQMRSDSESSEREEDLYMVFGTTVFGEKGDLVYHFEDDKKLQSINFFPDDNGTKAFIGMLDEIEKIAGEPVDTMSYELIGTKYTWITLADGDTKYELVRTLSEDQVEIVTLYLSPEDADQE